MAMSRAVSCVDPVRNSGVRYKRLLFPVVVPETLIFCLSSGSLGPGTRLALETLTEKAQEHYGEGS